MAASIKVVIQDRSTRLYLHHRNQWTAEFARAAAFPDTRHAALCAGKSRLPHLDVLLRFGDPKYDLRLTGTA